MQWAGGEREWGTWQRQTEKQGEQPDHMGLGDHMVNVLKFLSWVKLETIWPEKWDNLIRFSKAQPEYFLWIHYNYHHLKPREKAKAHGRGWKKKKNLYTIKDTWTKSRGRVEGWGEKAYNCNWITIKIKKNKVWQTKKNSLNKKRKRKKKNHTGWIQTSGNYYSDLLFFFVLQEVKVTQPFFINFQKHLYQYCTHI